MADHPLIDALLNLETPSAQEHYLRAHDGELDDRLVVDLKAQADHALRADIKQCERIGNLILIVSEVSGNPLHRAAGLRVLGNAAGIGRGAHQSAVPLYDEAASIYRQAGKRVDQAQSQTGKLWALVSLGRYREALVIGRWARGVLKKAGEGVLLANLVKNLGIIYGRMNEDETALGNFDEAKRLYIQNGSPPGSLPGLEYNRAIVLRNLGRFDESIAASEAAIDRLNSLDQPIRSARAKQSLAVTYYVLGHYNQAVLLLEEVRAQFFDDGRTRDALLAELFLCDCLLDLRRFDEVVTACTRIRARFSQQGNRLEWAQALRTGAVAFAHLGDLDRAKASLLEARRVLEEEGNEVWAGHTDLDMAAILLREGRLDESETFAARCAGIYRAFSMPSWEAYANLVLARVAHEHGEMDRAADLAAHALAVGESLNLPQIQYPAHRLKAKQRWSQRDLTHALTEYRLAIDALDRLRGRLMVEHRAGYLVDKEEVYADAVRLCLEMDDPETGLELVERAKSRALQDLLAYRVNLGLAPRRAEDAGLIDDLHRLRGKRDQTYRRWLAADQERAGLSEEREAARAKDWADIQALEKEITGRWHTLLMRDAAYTREASLEQSLWTPIQPQVPADHAIIEYFIAGDALLVFVVSAGGVASFQLPADISRIGQLLRLFQLNLRLVQASPASQRKDLAHTALPLLQELYGLLLGPFSSTLGCFTRLTIVPHGLLHYLPFHALHDGERYLIERFEIHYLPAASLLPYCNAAVPAERGSLVLGHSSGGQLPYTVLEASTVAATVGGRVYLESGATVEKFVQEAANKQVIHLASHGDFRADNPLFSSLSLADGWLTTLDVFGLKLEASLVTLSGCQTGRSVLGGGDELLGMMRAFLYAGAASLALSLWVVEDRSTATLMETMYQGLSVGLTKAGALRAAQLELLNGASKVGPDYMHPYYWAPFVLVGAGGRLDGGSG